MSTNETIQTSSTGGQKAGNDERYDLIPLEPLRLLAKHYGVGAKKYDADNWRKGYDWRLSYSALCRHLVAFWSGEELDPETGSPHMIAVAWHAFTLSEFGEIHPEFDTRLKTLDARAIRQPEAPDPRVVNSLGEDERNSDWIDCYGNRWRWASGWRIVRSDGSLTKYGVAIAARTASPYVEVLPGG